jgi:Protein of unknown function (DUF3800)
MFTAFFDDSGTDGNSDIAVAACYVSAARGWGDFVREWDQVRWEEGFGTIPFHMADFVAPNKRGHKPWCDWDNAKKDHVYARLAKMINENKRIGIAVAVPKAIWDKTPLRVRRHYGRQHYTFAVRMCMNRIIKWREKSSISLPIRYVFDWEMQRSPKREEISKILAIVSNPKNQSVADLLGLELKGFSFEHKDQLKPLQAADILAWQMRSHMRLIWPLGHDDPSICHPGFRLLREDQNVDLGFFTKEQIENFVRDFDEINKIAPFPMLYK